MAALQAAADQQTAVAEAAAAQQAADAHAAAEQQVAAVQATLAARDLSIAQLRAEVAARESRIEQMVHVVAALEGGKAELARQVSSLQQQLEASQQRGSQLEAALREEHQLVEQLQKQARSESGSLGSEQGWRLHRLAACPRHLAAEMHPQLPACVQLRGGFRMLHGLHGCLCMPCPRSCRDIHRTQCLALAAALLPYIKPHHPLNQPTLFLNRLQVEGYERSRMALAKSFFENKTRSDAAKIIQRHWREHRMARMRKQQTEGYQVC